MSTVEELLESAVGAIGGSTREGQTEMAQAVSSSVDKGIHLLVQAGTGTGKSLAYLVPAAEYSSRTGNRVIVSTATLALQTQIIHRDLPRLFKAVKKTLDPLPRAALLKGRRNYVCKHKLGGGYPDEGEGMLFDLGADAEAGRKASDRFGLGEEIQRIRTWEKTTESGDRDDLLPGVSDRAWSEVSVNSFDCLGSNCPLYTECFAELARNNAAEADIVVTNHALLAIDAFGDNTVLPEHDVIIIDEAHELKDRVTNALSGQINTSMLSAATSSVRKHTIVQDGVVALLDSAAAALERAQSGVSEGLILNMSEALSLALAQIRDSARQIINDIGGKTEDSDAGRQMAKARCQEIFELAERFCDPGKNDVVWLSRSTFRERETTNLVVAPLSVAGTMRSGIFEDSTVVATSATLSLGGNFDAVAASLGLFGPDAPKWDSLDVGSPFDYGKQSILYVAAHLPRPGRSGLSEQALDELEELVTASKGGALGLFSSRAAANAAAEHLRAKLDIPILLQGDDGLPSLVSQFTADDQACLFGTMSLWQGVDVPGRTNRLVIIDRLPFPRPDDPLMQARSKDADNRGVNGFMAVSATHAALRLAQGAGRLIRSTKDRGVVAVLDSRLRSARYGGYLVNSMPSMWPTTDSALVKSSLGRLAATDD
ncbi:ATP-dependent DNA helicase [Brevibacterium aurantiacum]|uniref:DNA 5'-3' helicase n=3 Tax=Brevibacterium aurantiacum TaxID=273384 RepID=A0A2A3X052_BREAU|nr:ATP-dependent DNA helicase [Brevibacterium aurantiacum]AOP54196.1 DinG family ATP-dependent helicase YoaA [Brevibacterium aurantiacum]AZL06273.1 ATP-dependent DNA helicase [Brevibacterium aurantiacum]PCC17038.1 ATP-dependent DNA helicase [Brevibacterium aurantiacum]PCC43236.1 ATP-dependent DNA helicase [Brevibacterium aurantiacum]RCS99805.1 ATP-dependent DNA helicase [Brevibacterium aurantiacum]